MDGSYGYNNYMIPMMMFHINGGCMVKRTYTVFQVDERDKREFYIAYHRDNIIVRDSSVYNQSRMENRRRFRVEKYRVEK